MSDEEISAWRISRTCEGGACIEVGQGAAVIAIRDSVDPSGPVLAFSPRDWAAFTWSLKAARRDL